MNKHEKHLIYDYENIYKKGFRNIILTISLILSFLEMITNGYTQGCLFPHDNNNISCNVINYYCDHAIWASEKTKEKQA
jgi:hypothetical protein